MATVYIDPLQQSLSYRGKKLELFSLGKKRLRGTYVSLQSPERRLDPGGGWSPLPSNERGNGLTLRQKRFRLDIRKNFSSEMVIRHWKRLET